MNAVPSPERFPPQMMYHLLSATRRFEPAFYGHICREFNLDADRILGLFGKVDEVGAGQLLGVLGLLREHSSYHDITYLAGRNAFLQCAQEQGEANTGGGPSRFTLMVKALLPPYLGLARLNQMARGKVQFVELQNSVFARGQHSLRPLCGFYAGWLAECAALCNDGRCSVAEASCVATDANLPNCSFQVAM